MNIFKKVLSLITGMYLPAAMAFSLTSPDFNNNGLIPDLFTCKGQDQIPTLNWNAPPIGTKSFALTMLDPDAPLGTWTHWVVFNIPSHVNHLSKDNLSGMGGLNSWGKTNYGGPCPPSGTHHYIFTLYALDTMLDLPESTTLKQLQGSMNTHILGSSVLTGLYSN
jgi:Raf kinase inhibitor-like YbhB/YbcL family protein